MDPCNSPGATPTAPLMFEISNFNLLPMFIVAEDFNSSCSFLWVWSLILKEEHAEGV
jgi:hypothetical protein